MKRVCLALLILCFLLGGCTNNSNLEEIRIIHEKSFFKDYEIQNETVLIYCKVYIQNDSQQRKTVKLLGSFHEDHASGLLKESQIYASTEGDADEISFIVPPGGIALDVVFRGGFGGFSQKQNRLLPDIQPIITD